LSNSLHLAIALDGAGWHPDAWREPDARPDELFTAGYWVDLVREAEAGLADFVTIEDGLGLQSSRFREPDDRVDQVRGRLDAVLIAARVAPLTRHIGLVPTATITHTEPFHISKAIATLDYVSKGRAGVRVQVSGRANEAGHFGRRTVGDLRSDEQALTDFFDEAADYVEVIRRLWDSWEDDAEIRDAATGRFVDREKLHYIDFEGRFFSVKGPSITPRPPQGQPIVTALGHQTIPYRLAGRVADVAYITPKSAVDARAIADEVRGYRTSAEPLHLFGDVVVFLNADPAGYESDAYVFAGSAVELADLLEEWHAAGLSGFRLRPGAIPRDLRAITRELVPELQRRGLFRTAYEEGTLRERLGLKRPANRYAKEAVS
jgi:alkanesulfonate monooxygenase SsuD/methylene tetrahydromethanopterin reductase-like flavin-dependent oxidoreductase (luciferase family)